MYWALRNWLASEAPLHGYDVEFVDVEDSANVAAAIRPGATKLVWLETPSNPLWGVTDIADDRAPRACRRRERRRRIPPARRRSSRKPLELGADVVMHSATKYLNGHSDVVAGALCFRARRRTFRAGEENPPEPRA